jgi:hypothetical protein
MDRSEKISIILIVVTAAAAISSQRNAKGVGTPAPEAMVYHAASQLYSKLALYFGRRALEAEASYWKLVN